jgi:hypothetical protein
MRGMALRSLSDSKYVDLTDPAGSKAFVNKNRASASLILPPNAPKFKATTKEEYDATYARGLELLEDIKTGQHDKPWMEMAGFCAEPTTKLTQSNMDAYVKANLNQIACKQTRAQSVCAFLLSCMYMCIVVSNAQYTCFMFTPCHTPQPRRHYMGSCVRRNGT